MATFIWPPSDGSGGGSGTVTQIDTIDSLTGGPITATGTISLVGDAASPGANQVYGTNGAGVKGWKADPSSTSTTQNSIVGDGSGGNPLELDGDVNAPGSDQYYGTDNSGIKGWFALPTSGISLETNGTPNGDQTLLNLIAGTGVTLTDDGVGGITIDSSGFSGNPTEIVYLDSLGAPTGDNEFTRDIVAARTRIAHSSGTDNAFLDLYSNQAVLGINNSTLAAQFDVYSSGFTSRASNGVDVSGVRGEWDGISNINLILMNRLYEVVWPELAPNVGDVLSVQSSPYPNGWQLEWLPGGGSGLLLEVDGTPNGDQSLLNLISGTGITLTDDGLGGVTVEANILNGPQTEILYYDNLTGDVTSDLNFTRDGGTGETRINDTVGETDNIFAFSFGGQPGANQIMTHFPISGIDAYVRTSASLVESIVTQFGNESGFRIGNGSLTLYNGSDNWLWPTTDSAGALLSDGSGNLSWGALGVSLIGQTSGLISNPTPAGTEQETFFGEGAGAGVLTTSMSPSDISAFGFNAFFGGVEQGRGSAFGSQAGEGSGSGTGGGAGDNIFWGYRSGYNTGNVNNAIYIGNFSGQGELLAGPSLNKSILIGHNTLIGGNFAQVIAIGDGATGTRSYQFIVEPSYTEIEMGGASKLLISSADDQFSLADSDTGFFYVGPGGAFPLPTIKGFGIDTNGATEEYFMGNNDTGETYLRIDNVAGIFDFAGAYNFPNTGATAGGQVLMDVSGTGVVSWASIYNNLIITGHTNEALYISPTDTVTSDVYFTRNASSGFDTHIQANGTGFASALDILGTLAYISSTEVGVAASYIQVGGGTAVINANNNALTDSRQIEVGLVDVTIKSEVANVIDSYKLPVNSATVANSVLTDVSANGTTTFEENISAIPGISNNSYGAAVNLLASTRYVHVTFSGAPGSFTTVAANAALTVGTIVIISDLGGDCSTSNITFDAGTGHTIRTPTGNAQTDVMSTDGDSRTYQMVTSTEWMQIFAN